MLKQSIIQGFTSYTLSSTDGETHASFLPQRGGILYSLVMPGKKGSRELLFTYDNFWTAPNTELVGASPFCFPICGRLQRLERVGCYYYDGQVYQLPMHGFAWQEAWEVDDIGNDYIVFSLSANATTRSMYPFDFNIRLRYEVRPQTLICQQYYQNCGQQAMPYYAGFHPYFLTPPPDQGKELVMLNFNAERRFEYNDSLTDLIGTQPILNLPTAITNPAINEQLSELTADKTIHLQYSDGDLLAMRVVGVEDKHLFPLLQLYTEVDKPFICIEPWMSYPNALNSVHGVRWLAPDQTEQGVLTLRLN